MAKAFKVNLSIEQGATFRKRVTWKAGAAPGVPVDLAGCTARAHIRTEIEAAAVLVTLTTANGGIVLGGATGTVDLYISDDDTAALTWTSGVYDLEIEFPGGDVRRLMYGSVSVSPEVTRG